MTWVLSVAEAAGEVVALTVAVAVVVGGLVLLPAARPVAGTAGEGVRTFPRKPTEG